MTVVVIRGLLPRLGDDREDGDACLPFLGNSGVCSGFCALSVVGLGAKVLALVPVLGV